MKFASEKKRRICSIITPELRKLIVKEELMIYYLEA